MTEINANGVSVGAEHIASATVLWAAGVQPSSLNKKMGVALDKSGRVIVGADLSLESDRNVFIIGDQAHVEDEKKQALPGLAPVALQQGRHVAQNIICDLKLKARKDFRYNDKGQMATIGRRKAVAQVGSLEFSGLVAWLAWLIIHIYFLIGFKNRLFVLLQWAWSNLTLKRGARIILNKEWKLKA